MKSIIRKAMVALWVLYTLFGVICCIGGEPVAGLFLALPNILSLLFVRMTKENAPAPAPTIPEPVVVDNPVPTVAKEPLGEKIADAVSRHDQQNLDSSSTNNGSQPIIDKPQTPAPNPTEEPVR